MRVSTDPLRIATAIATLAIGAIHLRLYFLGYRNVAIANTGRSFLLNAGAAVAAAAVLMLWWHRLAIMPALSLAIGTLVAFGLSRSDDGFFGFTERGWAPTPWAGASVFVEIAAAVFATVSLATSVQGDAPMSARVSNDWSPPPSA